MDHSVVEEESMSLTGPMGQISEPFPESRLDALLLTAARDAPDHVIFRDDDGPSTAADLDRRVDRLAGLLRLAALGSGERVLIIAGAQTAAFVALVGVLRAGLEPVLASCGLGAIEIAACARTVHAAALIGPAGYGALELGETYLSAAAIADTIRLIATQGPVEVDGALDVSAARLDATPAFPPFDTKVPFDMPTIGTFQGSPSAPTLVAHRQAALFADALSLVEQAHINPSKPIVSTLPPASLAGLVAGPFAALVGASGLVLHGPFDAGRFLAVCDRECGYHLVLPAAAGDAFASEALTTELASLILVSRFANAAAFALPAPSAAKRPVVDLYAFGEETLLAQRRIDGRARPPARVADKSLDGGLGAKLNRARADTLLHGEGA